MMKTASVCAILLLGASVLTAQQKPEPKKTEPKTASASAEHPESGQPVNMRLDLTITDDRGTGQPTSKTVSIMTADRYWGRIRTQGEIATSDSRRVPVILNVDARPTLVRDNRARVEITIEYRPALDGLAVMPTSNTRPDSNELPPNVNEMLAVVLEDGKPLLISQSADPISARRVKIEAKLAILR
jgi:hypothetical protein